MYKMDVNKEKKISKALSYWLRHNPDDIGIILDVNGWTNVDELIEKSNVEFDLDDLKHVVENNNKQRFSLKKHHVLKGSDKYFVRANQGHSVEGVDLELEEVVPPQTLFHGAPVGVIDSIIKEGLKKMNRHACHLSKDIETAKEVANRRSGEKVIFKIEAMRMRADGYKIFISDNGVYLTEEVPSNYISILETYK